MADPYEKGYDLGFDPYDEYPTDPYHDIRPNRHTKLGGRLFGEFIFWFLYTHIVLPIARLGSRFGTWRFEHRFVLDDWRRWWAWHRPWL
jgi:hypothetical protein